MSKRKQPKITTPMQRVAVDILTELIVNEVEVPEGFYEKIMETYNLQHDPFTSLPCTSNDYYESRQEYDRQTMMERYGHCDGL